MGICQIRHINSENVSAAIGSMPQPDIIQSLADLFKALGDPTRLKIVTALVAVELCVCDLSVVCGVVEGPPAIPMFFQRPALFQQKLHHGNVISICGQNHRRPSRHITN